MKSNLENKTKIPIIDGRAEQYFEEGNMIPTARNIPSWSVLYPDKRYLEDKCLVRKFKEKGGVVDPRNDRIIIHCDFGVDSSSLCVALRNLGNKNVQLFDGSHDEWRIRNRIKYSLRKREKRKMGQSYYK